MLVVPAKFRTRRRAENIAADGPADGLETTSQERQRERCHCLARSQRTGQDPGVHFAFDLDELEKISHELDDTTKMINVVAEDLGKV